MHGLVHAAAAGEPAGRLATGNPWRIGRARRIALLWTVAWLLAPRPAHAWVQYHTLPDGAGCGLRWQEADVGLGLDATPLDGVPDAALVAALQAGLDAWQDVACPLCSACVDGLPATAACPAQPLGQHLAYLGRGTPTPIGATCTAPAAAGGCDRIAGNGNWVHIVHDQATWQAQGVSHLVVALTVLTYDRSTGAIRDADILLDDWSHDFCVAPSCAADAYDVQQTLTHELGHVLGLDHSADPQATMFAAAQPKEINKRLIHADDQLGICTTYRTVCDGCPAPPAAAGCTAGPRASLAPAFLLLALAWGTLRRARIDFRRSGVLEAHRRLLFRCRMGDLDDD